MPDYHLRVERSDRANNPWSAVFVSEGWYLESRRYAEIPSAAQAVAAQQAGLDAAEVTIHIDSVHVDGRDVLEQSNAAREARREADRASQRATALTRDLVADLRSADLSVREVGAIIGLAPQRISAIEQQITRSK
ncbi:hypothetical protein [Prescottella equi]|uniref:hypothetical protein n=1 Tax=Rhodococcus hoagii TaxID=43767 RepID=UPI002741A612|nr:hypothetical protein [Prescottella equi]MDP8017667.1 hypothetical protein [Prescottella equi]